MTATTSCSSRSNTPAPAGASCQTWRMDRSSELQVGLKLLIQCASSSSSASGSSWSRTESRVVVLKSSLRPVRAPRPSPSSSPPPLPELKFLKACGRCNKELNPQMDVFMYMGDQAFCSAECRYKQILMDERREFEAAFKRDQLRASESRRRAAAEAHGGVRPAGGWRRVSAVAAA